jgi:hypothetical protein
MNKQYEIKTMLDFLQVPDDKIDACMEDFKHCLLFWRILPLDVMKPSGEFIWVDDGKPGVSEARIRAEGEEIGTIKFTTGQ